MANKMDVEKFCEAFGKILSEKYNMNIEVTATKKEKSKGEDYNKCTFSKKNI